MNESRISLDETIANMFSNNEYSNSYLFYAHMISQCKITIRNDMPAAAGVSFYMDHYNLFINEEIFKEYPLEQRLGILKHEMSHILFDHLGENRIDDDNHNDANIAYDCAINQFIVRSHLPEYAIYPDNFLVQPCKPSQNSEYYFDLLKNNPQQEEESGSCNGTGKDESGAGTYPGQGKLVDTHETWEESVGDKDLQKDVSKTMIERAISDTTKSKGNLPENISDMLSLFTRTSQVNWKRVLKQIVGNKKIGKRPTIMKKPRRFKNRPDLKGKTKDRMFTIVVGVDISGSMSTEEILTGLTEIHTICKLTKTKMKLIQIDTKIHKIEEFSENTKLFERTGCGGTYLGSCPEYIMENRIECDALVMISDMYIEDVSSDSIWGKWKKRTIWLATEDCIPEWNGWNKHKILPLKV